MQSVLLTHKTSVGRREVLAFAEIWVLCCCMWNHDNDIIISYTVLDPYLGCFSLATFKKLELLNPQLPKMGERCH